MSYKIVIPSYNRLSQLIVRTLDFLFRHNIDHSKIYIFVHPLSYDEYEEVLKTKYPNINIIESKCGIKNSRNYINDYFNEGDKIVEIDDDVEDLIDLREDKPLENLNEFIEESFSMCGNGMFGVSVH
jgi:L-rhamnose mutarotase